MFLIAKILTIFTPQVEITDITKNDDKPCLRLSNPPNGASNDTKKNPGSNASNAPTTTQATTTITLPPPASPHHQPKAAHSHIPQPPLLRPLPAPQRTPHHHSPPPLVPRPATLRNLLPTHSLPPAPLPTPAAHPHLRTQKLQPAGPGTRHVDPPRAPLPRSALRAAPEPPRWHPRARISHGVGTGRVRCPRVYCAFPVHRPPRSGASCA